jgi:hypothetical protein
VNRRRSSVLRTLPLALQGETLARSSVLDAVLLEALGSVADPDRTAVLHARPGAPDRAVTPVGAPDAGIDGLLHHAGAIEAVVVPTGGGGYVISGADLARLDLPSVAGLDPDLGWRRVSGPAMTGTAMTGPADGPAVAPGWGPTATARRALAHELIGVSRSMLTLALGHARERHQFGRAIGSFRAVQTRLADVPCPPPPWPPPSDRRTRLIAATV